MTLLAYLLSSSSQRHCMHETSLSCTFHNREYQQLRKQHGLVMAYYNAMVTKLHKFRHNFKVGLTPSSESTPKMLYHLQSRCFSVTLVSERTHKDRQTVAYEVKIAKAAYLAQVT